MTTTILIAIAGLAILAVLKPTERQIELAIEDAERRPAPRNAGRRAR